jgi:hypothetical protein
MDTNNLKKFAQETRRKLLEQVGARLSFVLNADSAELREKTEQVKQLREELNKISKEQLIEKVAYTWFNRLMALRFMDANDYQPLGIRVITPKDGYTTPELLDEAKRGNIPDELRVNKQKVYDILDNRIPSTNPQNEAYKELLIASCNHLNDVLPFLFERINDYSELLLPDDLTSDFSIVTDVRNGMVIEECQNVEIIGWLYQFYISEEKDRLINAKKVYKSYEIAPVTQLFTPKWIVQYMVDNTLGQFWKEARPKTQILKHLEFYIKPENEEIIPKREVRSPEDFTFFDPCVGSAHILCYAFDVYYKIYEEEGYNLTDVPELIITKNLFGIDIDERAAQLACFALMMKGRQNDRRFLNRGIIPNIISFQNFETYPKFINAKTFGSLIKIISDDLNEIEIEENSLFEDQQQQLKKQASYLANKYDILVTNPPYLNSSYMEGELKRFIEGQYNSTKSDLFACFLMQAIYLTKAEGLIGYISPFVWMFISSYEKLRDFVIENTTISSLIQLEYNAFEPACVPISTCVLRNKNILEYRGSYIKLSEFKGHLNQAPKTLEAIRNHNCGWFFTSDQKSFKEIPSYPIGYWISDKFRAIFLRNKVLKDFSDVRVGMSTASNLRFIRIWHEVNLVEFSLKDGAKWYPLNNGGSFRKWYGNREDIVLWENNGSAIKNTGAATIRNSSYYFKKGLSWTSITSKSFNVRFFEEGFLFTTAGFCAFPDDKSILSIAGVLNSKISSKVLELLSPTMNFNVGDICNVPIIQDVTSNEIVDSCITISKLEWNSHEISWDFRKNELIRIQNSEDVEIEVVYDLYCQYWRNKFFQLHQNEETLNRNFIEIYDLDDELTRDVPLEEITLLQDELDRKILEKLQGKLSRDLKTFNIENYSDINLPFIAKEVMVQFISYAVGCMFGRYSLDKENLILANQGDTLQDYLRKIEKSSNDCDFLPDEDNIIPVLDDEWFDDDITGRFYQFLKVTFGEKNFSKNLAFIEDQLGKDIRKYLTRDFYPDHIKRYKKRPIYWMFSSPKGSFNVLIYMHRYTTDTVNNILNKYLREFIGKLKTRREHLQDIMVNGSPAQKTSAIKENDNIDKMLIELRDYERDILLPLATERIAIDLDDGVLVNYNKFGKAVKDVAGLNDAATKKKVREFDWIDSTTII